MTRQQDFVTESGSAKADTKLFCMSRSAMILKMFGMFGILPISICGVISLLLLISGFIFDLRLIVLAMIVVCIVGPMLMAFLYFNYGLKEDCFINIIPHNMTIEDSGIRIDVYVPEQSEKSLTTSESDIDYESNSDSEQESEQKLNIRQPICCRFRYTRFLPFKDLAGYYVGTNCVTLLFRIRHRGFIWLPLDAFDSSNSFQTALEKIVLGMKQIITSDENNKG